MNAELILKFLKDLKRNNNREWFERNKDRYLEAKQSFQDIVAVVLEELVKFDKGLAGLDPAKLPFRIYRDVRFSKDKTPYKTNMGAGFSPNGKLVEEPGYYLHFEPGKCFVAGGLYIPSPPLLAKVRQEIDYNGDRFVSILKERKFRQSFKGLDDFDKLKTAPKGYPKDHPHVEFLKHRSFIVSKQLTDTEVKNKRFPRDVAGVCKTIKPLNDFIREAIS